MSLSESARWVATSPANASVNSLTPANGIEGQMSGIDEPASHRWHRGFLRLYLVVAAFWLIGFGYTAYDANHQMSSALSRMESASADFRAGRASQLTTLAKNHELSDRYDEQRKRRNLALYALALFPVGAPTLYLIAMWILAGFRLGRKTQTGEPTVGRR